MARRSLMDETEAEDLDIVDLLVGEYAAEDDCKLTTGAKRLKRRLLRILKKHGFVPAREGINNGIREAASFIETFDGKVDHPWRLSDVVLFKFGLIGQRKVRKVRGIDPQPGRMVFRTLPQRTVREKEQPPAGAERCPACAMHLNDDEFLGAWVCGICGRHWTLMKRAEPAPPPKGYERCPDCGMDPDSDVPLICERHTDHRECAPSDHTRARCRRFGVRLPKKKEQP